ncbi:hypothetical protein [Streptomyces sp. NPDC055749]
MSTSLSLLRLASWGAALLALTLITGCSDSDNPPPDPSPTPSVTKNTTPSPPEPEEVSPEPSPAISYLGKTKIVTAGDVEIRATRNEIGINVACNVTNTTDETRNIRVKVSIGDGKDWVTTNNFDFKSVPAGQSASESTVMGASFAGDLPDDPKVYIDSVDHY